MRQHLAAETTRVVTAVWWGVYSVRDALMELRGQAFLISERNGVDEKIADAVAMSAFDDEMQRQEAEHGDSIAAMSQAAYLLLRQGKSLKDARSAVAAVARDRPIQPTPHMMTHALEHAASEHRKAERWHAWQTQREMAE